MTTEKKTTHSPAKKPNSKKNWALFDKANKQHMYIMSLCKQLDWTCEHPRWGEVADLSRLSEWLKSDKSPVNLPLMDMLPAELSKIINALSGMNTKQFSNVKQ